MVVQCWKFPASLMHMRHFRGGLLKTSEESFDSNFHQSFCSTLKKGLGAKSTGGCGFLQPRGNCSLNR